MTMLYRQSGVVQFDRYALTTAKNLPGEEQGLTMHNTPNASVEAAADIIANARIANKPLGALPPSLRPRDAEEAYLTQEAVHKRLAPRVGYKIGCTTAVMQQYLGIAQPCAGGIFDYGIYSSGVTLDRSAFVQVGVECEIAVRVGRDLIPSDAPFTATEISQSVGSYMPAIEIVDDRYADWRKTDTPTLIADDFFSAGCILGHPVAPDRAPDLSLVEGRTFINGIEAGRGVGSDVMGHPHNALAWLSNHLATRGKALKEGEIVLTGSLVQTIWLKPGDEVEVRVAGLGSVSVRLSE